MKMADLKVTESPLKTQNEVLVQSKPQGRNNSKVAPHLPEKKTSMTTGRVPQDLNETAITTHELLTKEDKLVGGNEIDLPQK